LFILENLCFIAVAHRAFVVVTLTVWHDIEQLACTSAEEAEKWVSAFKHAKEEADYASERNGNGHRVMSNDNE
jgi:hypothetical protein